MALRDLEETWTCFSLESVPSPRSHSPRDGHRRSICNRSVHNSVTQADGISIGLCGRLPCATHLMCIVEHENPLCGNGTQESLLGSEIQFAQTSAEYVEAGVQLHAGLNSSMLARAYTSWKDIGSNTLTRLVNTGLANTRHKAFDKCDNVQLAHFMASLKLWCLSYIDLNGKFGWIQHFSVRCQQYCIQPARLNVNWQQVQAPIGQARQLVCMQKVAAWPHFTTRHSCNTNSWYATRPTTVHAGAVGALLHGTLPKP